MPSRSKYWRLCIMNTIVNKAIITTLWKWESWSNIDCFKIVSLFYKCDGTSSCVNDWINKNDNEYLPILLKLMSLKIVLLITFMIMALATISGIGLMNNLTPIMLIIVILQCWRVKLSGNVADNYWCQSSIIIDDMIITGIALITSCDEIKGNWSNL